MVKFSILFNLVLDKRRFLLLSDLSGDCISLLFATT